MPNSITDILDRLGDSSRLTPILVGVVAVAVIWGVSQYGTAPNWVPVVSGLPIERMEDATTRLEEAGIAHKLERGGALLTVHDSDLARARVMLAAEGLTPSDGAPGFELFDQPAWGMTDFTQRVNYRRALEGELQRTIREMRGVESASVHLAMRAGSFLTSDKQGSDASVVLRLTSGGSADPSVVEGIQSLVASSVEAMSPERVAVLDDRGRLLSSPTDGSGAGMTTAQLKVRRGIEEYLEQRAQDLVIQVVGPGNATIRVAAQLNFDQIDRTIQALDPDQQMLVQEDRSEIVPGADQQGAGSVTSNTRFESTRSVETLVRDGARIERLTVAVVVGDRRIEAADGTVTYQARSADELRRIEALVSNSVGVSVDRGDEVTVMSTTIERPELPVLEDPGFDVAGFASVATRPAVTLAALGTVLFLALRILGMLKTVQPLRSGPALLGHSSDGLLAPGTPALPAIEPPRASAVANTGLALADPEMTARVLRNWMREG